jgi:hypothetical protein
LQLTAWPAPWPPWPIFVCCDYILCAHLQGKLSHMFYDGTSYLRLDINRFLCLRILQSKHLHGFPFAMSQNRLSPRYINITTTPKIQ